MEREKLNRLLLMPILSDYDLGQVLLAKFRSFGELLEIIFFSLQDEPFLRLSKLKFYFILLLLLLLLLFF